MKLKNDEVADTAFTPSYFISLLLIYPELELIIFHKKLSILSFIHSSNFGSVFGIVFMLKRIY